MPWYVLLALAFAFTMCPILLCTTRFVVRGFTGARLRTGRARFCGFSKAPATPTRVGGRALVGLAIGRAFDRFPVHRSAWKVGVLGASAWGVFTRFACIGICEVRRYEERRDAAQEEGREVNPGPQRLVL
ncbi:MAG: hypothetical protein AVDCRST_MAG12-55 [uncultured Rubrobacteraceae bacterium]|uniref:Uncharacterized protein n=1 Tax=uncultured Rubrobacteraceae bacterium TaxID=349277 RepID=A0A6J4RAN2_9ACTN|nr:MAG: hypothetical protein AVDCRST_MAG12-55 [uncultured Rubrobacteraceae bacterium]